MLLYLTPGSTTRRRPSAWRAARWRRAANRRVPTAALVAMVARATPIVRAPETLRARIRAELDAAARAGASRSTR